MMALQQWDKAADRLTELIRTNPDQWSNIKRYISCQIRRAKALKELVEGEEGVKSQGLVETEGGKCTRHTATTSQTSKDLREDGEVNCVGRGEESSDDKCDSSRADREQCSAIEELGGDNANSDKCGDSERCSATTGLGSGDVGSDRCEHSERCCTTPGLSSNGGSEDYLGPIRDAQDLMESLVEEEQRIRQSEEKSRYVLRGPYLGRMELVRQLYQNGVHQEIPNKSMSILILCTQLDLVPLFLSLHEATS